MPSTSMTTVTDDAYHVDTAITNEGNKKDLSQEQDITIDVDGKKNTDGRSLLFLAQSMVCTSSLGKLSCLFLHCLTTFFLYGVSLHFLLGNGNI